VEVSGELHITATLPLVKNLSMHSIGGWVGPRASLDTFGEKKNFLFLPGIELQTIPLIAKLLYCLLPWFVGP
jgi:hypothetical protein